MPSDHVGMAIASGKDNTGSGWLALYCDICSTSISSTQTLDVEALRREHGWRGHVCPRCAERGDEGIAPPL